MLREMRTLLGAALLAAIGSGCAGFDSLVVGTTSRDYLIHIPDQVAESKRPAPLVLVFHGGGSGARSMRSYSRFDEVADEHGFVVVYPDGTGSGWNDGRESPPIGASEESVDDVAFIRELIATLSARIPIDRDRIYATGISNGAMFSLRLGCELGEVLAAIAPVAGSLPEPLLGRCRPARPISLLLIHGTNDEIVPYNGGPVIQERGRVAGVDKTIEVFRDSNQCAGVAVESQIDKVKTDETRVLRATWATCLEGAVIERDRIEGGGHTWPGSTSMIDFVRGTVSEEIDAPVRIWAFFAAHPRQAR